MIAASYMHSTATGTAHQHANSTFLLARFGRCAGGVCTVCILSTHQSPSFRTFLYGWYIRQETAFHPVAHAFHSRTMITQCKGIIAVYDENPAAVCNYSSFGARMYCSIGCSSSRYSLVDLANNVAELRVAPFSRQSRRKVVGHSIIITTSHRPAWRPGQWEVCTIHQEYGRRAHEKRSDSPPTVRSG